VKHYGFSEKDVEPATVVDHIKRFLIENGFHIDRETSHPNLWDLRASKRGAVRIAVGAVRDADVVVAGSRGKFEVQFKLGVWGRDLAVPVVEGIATVGLATAMDLHEEHVLEDKMWRSIVHLIDANLLICEVCGAIFQTPEDLRTHQTLEAERAQSGQGLYDRLATATFTANPVMWV